MSSPGPNRLLIYGPDERVACCISAGDAGDWDGRRQVWHRGRLASVGGLDERVPPTPPRCSAARRAPARARAVAGSGQAGPSGGGGGAALHTASVCAFLASPKWRSFPGPV